MKHTMKLVLAMLLAMLLALPTFVMAEDSGAAEIVAMTTEEPWEADSGLDPTAEDADGVAPADGEILDEAASVEEEALVEEALVEEEVPGTAGDALVGDGALFGEVLAEADAAGAEELTIDLSEAMGDLPEMSAETSEETEAPPEDIHLPVDSASEGEDPDNPDDEMNEAGEPTDEAGEPTDETGEPTDEAGEPTDETAGPGEESAERQPVRVRFEGTPETAVIGVYPAPAETSEAEPDDEPEAQPEGGTFASIPPEADGSYLLMPGEYAYSAGAEGYAPIENEPFTVPEGEEALTISFALEPTAAVGAAPRAQRSRSAPDDLQAVSYLTVGGSTGTAYCAVYDNNAYLESGWYAVQDDFVVDSIYVKDDVNLLLCDGTTLTVQSGIVVTRGNSLTLWAQSAGEDMGVLYAGTNAAGDQTCGAAHAGIGSVPSNQPYCGTIVINGGNIHARGHDKSGNDEATAAIGGRTDSSGRGCEIIINGGRIEAIGGDYAAGIGSSETFQTGPITINGGTVIAKSDYGAGIGAGHYGACANIVIADGDVKATCDHGVAIGGAESGTVEIRGGQVVATSASGKGISGNTIRLNWEPDSTGAVPTEPKVTAGSYSAASGVDLVMAFRQEGGSEVFYAGEAPDLSKLAQKPIVPAGYYNVTTKVAAGRGTLNVSKSHPAKGDTITVQAKADDNYELSELTYTAAGGGNPITIGQNNGAYTFSMPANHVTVTAKFKRLHTYYYDPIKEQSLECPTSSVFVAEMADKTVWNKEWYVAMGECDIDKRVTVTGNVNLVLLNDSHLNAKEGITVEGANSLTVWEEEKNGTGRLTATGIANAAGIGGTGDKSGGTITLYGGTIDATGGNYGAGIGGGIRGSGGNITISGHTVVEKAEGGSKPTSSGEGYVEIWHGVFLPDSDLSVADYSTILGGGAGIGGGARGDGGTIVISGHANIKEATGNPAVMTVGGAGIGGGNNAGGGSITISGGKVIAYGGQNAAGIGGGENGPGGTIAISGGEVEATGGLLQCGNCCGAGIGGGRNQSGGKITISGVDTVVKAYAAHLAAAIGGGKKGDGGEITIKGGNITAIALTTFGHSYGAGIGGGYGGSGGRITIEGGSINATGGTQSSWGNPDCDYGGAGIGGGSAAGCGEIVIKGGVIDAYGGVYSAGVGTGGCFKTAISSGGTITIEGGEIKAHGGTFGAGIGGGYHLPCDSIAITGGTITEAISSCGGAGIGGGYAGSCSSVVISGGTVNAKGAPALTVQGVPAAAGIGDGPNALQNSGVTLTWKQTATGDHPDFPIVYSDSYCAKVKLARPFQYTGTGGTTVFLPPTANADTTALAGVTLSPAGRLYSVTIDDAIQHGTVTSDKGSAATGETVTLTATPETGWLLKSVTVTDVGSRPVQVGNDLSFTMPDSDVTVSAAFWTTEGVTVSPASAKLLVGKSKSLTAAVAPGDFPQDVTWTSSDDNVATVDPSGKVTAESPGSATITAETLNGQTATCAVTVYSAPTGVKLTPTKKTLKVKKTLKLKATVKGKNAYPTLTWTSSNKKVATVSKKGVVTALKPGRTTITVKTVNGKKARCVITVSSSLTGTIKFD